MCTVLIFLTVILVGKNENRNERKEVGTEQLLSATSLFFYTWSRSERLLGTAELHGRNGIMWAALDIWDQISCGVASVDDWLHSLTPQTGGSTSLNLEEKFLTQ